MRQTFPYPILPRSIAHRAAIGIAVEVTARNATREVESSRTRELLVEYDCGVFRSFTMTVIGRSNLSRVSSALSTRGNRIIFSSSESLVHFA